MGWMGIPKVEWERRGVEEGAGELGVCAVGCERVGVRVVLRGGLRGRVFITEADVYDRRDVGLCLHGFCVCTGIVARVGEWGCVG